MELLSRLAWLRGQLFFETLVKYGLVICKNCLSKMGRGVRQLGETNDIHHKKVKEDGDHSALSVKQNEGQQNSIPWMTVKHPVKIHPSIFLPQLDTERLCPIFRENIGQTLFFYFKDGSILMAYFLAENVKNEVKILKAISPLLLCYSTIGICPVEKMNSTEFLKWYLNGIYSEMHGLWRQTGETGSIMGHLWKSTKDAIRGKMWKTLHVRCISYPKIQLHSA